MTYDQREALAHEHKQRANLGPFMHAENRRTFERITVVIDGVHTHLELPMHGQFADIPYVRLVSLFRAELFRFRKR